MTNAMSSYGPTTGGEGLPPFDAMQAALDELIQTCEDRLTALAAQGAQGEPDVTAEKKFFQRQYTAFTKAQFYFLKGIRPLYAGRDAWLIPSGSRPGGPVHRITKRKGIWTCGPSCEAHDAFHWHPAIIAAVERAWELCELHDDAADVAADAAADANVAFAQAAYERAKAEINELWA